MFFHTVVHEKDFACIWVSNIDHHIQLIQDIFQTGKLFFRGCYILNCGKRGGFSPEINLAWSNAGIKQLAVRFFALHFRRHKIDFRHFFGHFQRASAIRLRFGQKVKNAAPGSIFQ
jgi:hypothetical protein